MNKELKDGTILKKAKFIRIKCKFCGEEMSKGQIMNGQKYCSKKHKKAFINKCKTKK